MLSFARENGNSKETYRHDRTQESTISVCPQTPFASLKGSCKPCWFHGDPFPNSSTPQQSCVNASLAFVLPGQSDGLTTSTTCRDPQVAVRHIGGMLLLRRAALCSFALFCASVRACVEFLRVDPRLFRFGSPKACDAVTVGIQPHPFALGCAHACSADDRCFAFLHDEGAQRCRLLSAACKASTLEESLTVMVRLRDSPTGMAWRFHRSKFIIGSTVQDSFVRGQEACARYGMYMWLPDSVEKWEFFKQKINGSVTAPYSATDLWIGVVDRPNDNCLLSDWKTKCPVKKYLTGEPNYQNQECTKVKTRNGEIGFYDMLCSDKIHPLCEGRY